MRQKIQQVIEKLEAQGHSFKRCFLGDRALYEVDGRMTVTGEQLGHLADGVYSFDELKSELLERRRTDEQGTL